MEHEKGLSSAERDQKVLNLYDRLLEIEQRLIPTGLHVFGRPSQAKQKLDLLRMVASFDRPESGLHALPDLIGERLRLIKRGELENATRVTRERIDSIVSQSITIFLQAGKRQAEKYLADCANVSEKESHSWFELLEEVVTRLDSNSEMDALMRALNGEYIQSGPGADVVQNPAILPTGRNTHAINPYSVPSVAAFARAEAVAASLLTRYCNEHGRYPRSMALVLWGLDNIKTQGEGVAQALWLLGVRPVRDRLNRVTTVEPIPLRDLNRPRIDIVLTVSGIFRDLFSPTVQVLDRAVRMVAQLEEPEDLNYVRAHVQQQMEAESCGYDDAATRVFSNAPGNYGTNVNFMVMDSQWAQDETLGDLFVTRKCFAYGRDSAGRTIEGREARAAMDRALARVDATYQNIDTIEIGITDVDHYFEYLGGVSKAVEHRAQSRPAIYLSDTLDREAKIRTLEETVRLESRAKTLNPKWYEGMLQHGFRGVAEIENHVSNTFGWSATADAVDDWIYSDVARTFILDKEMFDRLRALNPHSTHSMIGRLLEAHGRGFWKVEAEVIDQLQAMIGTVEDQIEGV